MQIYRDLENIPTFHNAVATMGSFDGLHSGHQELLRRVCSLAGERSGESVVLTFEPHPRYVLGTGERMQLITSLEEKLLLLEQFGIDNVIIIPFTTEFSQKSPQEFLADIAQWGIKCMVVGYNHRFGHKKEGDYNYLESRGEMEIYMVEQQQVAQSKVSSTIIRQAISLGMIEKATQLLAHPYIVVGTIQDDGTVTDVDPHKLLPPEGVYDVRIGDCTTTLTIASARGLSLPKDITPRGKATIEII